LGTRVKWKFREIINNVVVCNPVGNAVLQNFHAIFNYYLVIQQCTKMILSPAVQSPFFFS